MIHHTSGSPTGRTGPLQRVSLPLRPAAVFGLMLLSPVSAEYLIGYGASTARPLELLAGLLILAPLYGTVAVLIREITRRTGRGWPTMLLLGAAFGLIQAGLIDQSLFHRDVAAGDPEWAAEPWTTIIPGLGADAATLLNYVGGHVIWSFAAPIAVVESCAGRLAGRPWLGPVGLGTMVLLWVPAAALIHSDTAANSTAGPGQLACAALAAAALVAAAFIARSRKAGTPATAGVAASVTAGVTAKAPPWWLAGGVAGAVFCASQLLPATWLGVTVNVAALVGLGGLLVRWSRRRGWGRGHLLAVAGAALVVRAGLSFAVEPLGGVDQPMKYAVNAATLAGVLLLLLFAWRRLRRQEVSAC